MKAPTVHSMNLESTVIQHLLNVIAHAPGIRIEDVAQLTPELTLREVFYTLCYLSRKGQLRLIVDYYFETTGVGLAGIYKLSLPIRSPQLAGPREGHCKAAVLLVKQGNLTDSTHPVDLEEDLIRGASPANLD